MSEFIPRIENPSATKADRRERARRANEKLREFVRAAAGKWCLIAEHKDTTKVQRPGIRARLWSVFMRINGYEVSGFEVRATYVEKVYKMYARFVAANVVKSPQ